MKHLWAFFVASVLMLGAEMAPGATQHLVVNVPPLSAAAAVSASFAETTLEPTVVERSDLTSSSPVSMETVSAWTQFIASVGAAPGLGMLGIAGVLVQFVMLVVRTNTELTGKAKIATVSALSVGLGAPALALVGLDWTSAIVHSGALAAFQVFGNQVFKQFVKKDAEKGMLA